MENSWKSKYETFTKIIYSIRKYFQEHIQLLGGSFGYISCGGKFIKINMYMYLEFIVSVIENALFNISFKSYS